MASKDRRRDSWALINVAIVLGGIFVAPIALAQPVPSTVDPGVIRRRFDPPPAPEAVIEEPAAERERRPEPELSSAQFLLLEIELEGSSIYRASEFKSLWDSYLGKQVSLRELSEIAAAITVRYRNDGYVLSRAVIPAQDVTDGLVRIRVIEGSIDDVRLEGDIDRKWIWRQITRDLKGSRPLEAKDLERAVLLLNDLPGSSTRAVLGASEENPGQSTLTLVADQQLFSGYVDANNRGTRFLGPYQGELGVTFDSWLGRYESTSIRVNQTFDEDLSVFSLDHSELLCACGTRLTLSGSYLRSEPGNDLSILEVEGESVSASLAVSHPWIRSRGMNLSSYLRLDYLDSKNDVSSQTLSEDNIRSVRVGATYDATDRLQGVSLFQIEVSQGLPIFGATDGGDVNPSRAGAEGLYTKVSGRIQRLQNIGPGFGLLVQGSAQYAIDELLAAEQFTFGGDDFGRGYDPAELIGDHGAAFLAELQWGRAFSYRFFQGLQVFASYDYGAIWRKRRIAPESSRISASSVALGVRLNLTSWLGARAMVALPLTRPATIDRDDGDKLPRGFFGVTARF